MRPATLMRLASRTSTSRSAKSSGFSWRPVTFCLPNGSDWVTSTESRRQDAEGDQEPSHCPLATHRPTGAKTMSIQARIALRTSLCVIAAAAGSAGIGDSQAPVEVETEVLQLEDGGGRGGRWRDPRQWGLDPHEEAPSCPPGLDSVPAGHRDLLLIKTVAASHHHRLPIRRRGRQASLDNVVRRVDGRGLARPGQPEPAPGGRLVLGTG